MCYRGNLLSADGRNGVMAWSRLLSLIYLQQDLQSLALFHLVQTEFICGIGRGAIPATEQSPLCSSLPDIINKLKQSGGWKCWELSAFPPWQLPVKIYLEGGIPRAPDHSVFLQLTNIEITAINHHLLSICLLYN